MYIVLIFIFMHACMHVCMQVSMYVYVCENYGAVKEVCILGLYVYIEMRVFW